MDMVDGYAYPLVVDPGLKRDPGPYRILSLGSLQKGAFLEEIFWADRDTFNDGVILFFSFHGLWILSDPAISFNRAQYPAGGSCAVLDLFYMAAGL